MRSVRNYTTPRLPGCVKKRSVSTASSGLPRITTYSRSLPPRCWSPITTSSFPPSDIIILIRRKLSTRCRQKTATRWKQVSTIMILTECAQLRPKPMSTGSSIWRTASGRSAPTAAPFWRMITGSVLTYRKRGLRAVISIIRSSDSTASNSSARIKTSSFIRTPTSSPSTIPYSSLPTRIPTYNTALVTIAISAISSCSMTPVS